MSEETTDPKAELTAMAAVNDALSGLESAQVARVLRWAADARGITGIVRKDQKPGGADVGGGSTPQTFEDIADLHTAASPETDIDRALVGGYWFQYVKENPDFTAYEVNVALNNLGHRLKNITTAYDTLQSRKPSLVVQLKKSGTSKQARKTYKLTQAGKQAVEAMIGLHQ